jgi:hypothetical protein
MFSGWHFIKREPSPFQISNPTTFPSFDCKDYSESEFEISAFHKEYNSENSIAFCSLRSVKPSSLRCQTPSGILLHNAPEESNIIVVRKT